MRLFYQTVSMKMHLGRQDKEVPIYRSFHAAHKVLHPFAHANDVDIHGGFVFSSFILRLPTLFKRYSFPKIN